MTVSWAELTFGARVASSGVMAVVFFQMGPIGGHGRAVCMYQILCVYTIYTYTYVYIYIYIFCFYTYTFIYLQKLVLWEYGLSALHSYVGGSSGICF